MAAKLYTVVQIDNVEDLKRIERSSPPGGSGDPSRGVEYHMLFQNTAPHNSDDLFLIRDAYNKQLEDYYTNVIDDMRVRQSCGYFVFEDIETVGFDSLLIDRQRARVYIGQMLNWSRDYFNWWIEYSDVGFVRWEDDESFVADFGDARPGIDHGIMMNSPGYGIFGHWLIDFVPRMAQSRLIEGSHSSTYLFGPLKEWMKDLISKSGISNHERVEEALSRHGRLIVPSSTNLGYGFFEPVNSLAWRSLSLSFCCENVGNRPPSPERLFVSRRHWQSERAIDYYEELEALMAELGFAVIYPETLSLAEQAWLFSKAKIVVGEDGSALHNVIFSAPGTRLGVLMDAERCNLWHAGICHLLGHKVAYAPLLSNADAANKGLSETVEFVRQLLSLDRDCQSQ